MKIRKKKRNRLSGSQKRKRNAARGAEWRARLDAIEEEKRKEERKAAWQEGWAAGKKRVKDEAQAEHKEMLFVHRMKRIAKWFGDAWFDGRA